MVLATLELVTHALTLFVHFFITLPIAASFGLMTTLTLLPVRTMLGFAAVG